MVIKDELIDELLGNREIKTQEDLFGKDGLLKQLSKKLMERLLEAEMTNHLGYARHAIEGRNSGNSRNGKKLCRFVSGSQCHVHELSLR